MTDEMGTTPLVVRSVVEGDDITPTGEEAFAEILATLRGLIVAVNVLAVEIGRVRTTLGIEDE